MGSERLRIYFDIIFDLLRVVTKLFDRVLWVGGPVSRGRSGITNPVGIRAITSALWAGNTYARGHGTGKKRNDVACTVSDVAVGKMQEWLGLCLLN
jgi:hypothetical protein